MNWRNISFDWNHVRAFLATAEEGNFSAAARVLNLTQPTLGRQVAAFEAHLGLTLFERHGRRVVLTEAGRQLHDHVQAMGDAAARISLAASGQHQSIDGHVSISASDVMSAYLLPPILKTIRDRAPSIEIEVIATNEIADIQRREADIAVRHVRPDQPDLIGKLLRQATAHMYASQDYIARYGRPTSAQGLVGHVLIGINRSDDFILQLQQFGIFIERSNIQLVTATGNVAWAMAQQGMGICIMIDDVAATDPSMVRLLPDDASVTFPIWLTTHQELRSSRRIRLVFDLLAEGLASVDTAAK